MRSTCQHRVRGTGARQFVECSTGECSPVVIGSGGNVRSRVGKPSADQIARLARAANSLARGVTELRAAVQSLRRQTPRRRFA